jgi:prevent-host-death family protein
MKRIPVQDLKARLSAAIAAAEAGETLVVTRHNEPVAMLGPARPAHVHRGPDVGQLTLRPAGRRASKGRYLVVLLEDRGER